MAIDFAVTRATEADAAEIGIIGPAAYAAHYFEDWTNDPAAFARQPGGVLPFRQIGCALQSLQRQLAHGSGRQARRSRVLGLVFGDLVAIIEVARASAPFRAREIARIEDVVEALTGRIVVQGWI